LPIAGCQNLARGQDFNADNPAFAVDVINERACLLLAMLTLIVLPALYAFFSGRPRPGRQELGLTDPGEATCDVKQAAE